MHARDRIGSGPWYNAKGVLIASNVAELHSDKANINNDTALDEQGRPINSQGAANRHDILTGSRADGTAFPGGAFYDMTCGNWTKSGADGSAMLGHFDRSGPIAHPWATSWNSSHHSRGCNQEGLVWQRLADGAFVASLRPQRAPTDDAEWLGELASPVLEELCERVMWPSVLTVPRLDYMETIDTNSPKAYFDEVVPVEPPAVSSPAPSAISGVPPPPPPIAP